MGKSDHNTIQQLQTPQETDQTEKAGKAWYLVFISALIGCSLSAGFPQATMTITALAAKSGMAEALLLTGDTVKSATIVLSMMASGMAYQKFGARPCFIFSMACAVVPQFFIPFISSPAIFLICKGIQGLASLIFPIFLVLIMDAIPERHTGLATAVFNGIFYSGGGVGGTVAGFFINHFGWISSYYAIGIIEGALAVIWFITVKKDKPAKSSEQTLNQEQNSQAETAKSVKGKSIPQLLRMPQVWILIAALVSTTFVVQAITIDLPLFSEDLGYDSGQIGSLSNAVSLGLIIACLISGKISDILAMRMNSKAKARILALAIGPVLIIVSALIMITTDLSHFGFFFFVTFLFSFGGSWGFGTFYSILPELFDRQTLPVITGLTGGAGDCGMPAAPLLVGVVFGARGLWSFGWGVCIAVAAISLAACLLLFFKSTQRSSTDRHAV